MIDPATKLSFSLYLSREQGQLPSKSVGEVSFIVAALLMCVLIWAASMLFLLDVVSVDNSNIAYPLAFGVGIAVYWASHRLMARRIQKLATAYEQERLDERDYWVQDPAAALALAKVSTWVVMILTLGVLGAAVRFA